MEKREILELLNNLDVRLDAIAGLFDIGKLREEKENLDKITKKEDFWNDLDQANDTYQQLKNINKIIKGYDDLKDSILLLTQLLELEEVDEKEVLKLENEINLLEINTLLTGEYDSNNCYLEIHPGAGGTESCDWANMLLRMYERFLDKNEYEYKIIDKQIGDEAGIKSVTIYIKGNYAYGYLKNEDGVHRLVRISSFDANKRRHTSFASVSVTPEFKGDMEVEIRDDDLKVDVYHSSGAGGQSVNTANSAVRITHLPTKTVVTCQTERSQLRNKEIAMSLLKNKIYQQKVLEHEKELKNIKGEISDTSFGNQIRSYILEPYKLVKDHRSKLEITDPSKVLDGDIKSLIESVLKIR
ncbi:MAG: peptide chain release factor 2 [Ruminococcus sp.]|nr:peptide chain release factor 2 [Ruminococcus sp.]